LAKQKHSRVKEKRKKKKDIDLKTIAIFTGEEAVYIDKMKTEDNVK
jgi:hypothetical protein